MAWEAIFKIFTFQDVQTTLIVLGLASYFIIYFEQFLWILPAAPICLILYIFNNLHTRSKFERPQKTPVANLKFIQAVMTYVPWALDVSYEMVENCLFWYSMEKTLVTLNILLMVSLALLVNAIVGGVPAIALRIVVAVSLWVPVCYHSPIFMSHLVQFINFVKPHGLSIYSKYIKFETKLELGLQKNKLQNQANQIVQ